jgi:hypothetical protein
MVHHHRPQAPELNFPLLQQHFPLRVVSKRQKHHLRLRLPVLPEYLLLCRRERDEEVLWVLFQAHLLHYAPLGDLLRALPGQQAGLQMAGLRLMVWRGQGLGLLAALVLGADLREELGERPVLQVSEVLPVLQVGQALVEVPGELLVAGQVERLLACGVPRDAAGPVEACDTHGE